MKLEKGNKATDWSPAPEDPGQSLVTGTSVTITPENGLEVAQTLSNGSQSLPTRFKANASQFGLYRASDNLMIAGAGVDASGQGYFAASQIKDVLAASDVVFELKSTEDSVFRHLLLAPTVAGSEYGGFGITIPKGAGNKKIRLLAQNDSNLDIHGNVNVAIGAGGGLSLSSVGTLIMSGASAYVYVGTDQNPAGAASFACHAIPNETNKYALGSTAYSLRWTRLYCVQSVDVSSDARLKKDIVDLDGSLIYKLRPRKFRLIDGNGKLRFGLVAQEVKAALDELGIVDADLYGDDNPESLSLVYEELIAPLIAAVQTQKGRIDALEARLAALEERA